MSLPSSSPPLLFVYYIRTSRTSRPKPVGLTWDGLAFVPTLPGSLFFLLGPSNTVLYTNLSESRPGGYVYGSHVIALDKHGARVRCMAVNSTGMLLATGDEKGNLRVWPLLGEHPGSTMMKPMGSLGNVMPDDMETKRWSEVKAHEGPVWAISHIDGGYMDTGLVATHSNNNMWYPCSELR